MKNKPIMQGSMPQLYCSFREMHAIEERYYKVSRVFLTLIGLCPYQQSYFALIQKVLLVIILLTFILAQFLVFITTQYNTNLLLKVLSFVFPTLFVTAKYCFSLFQTDSIKQMQQQIRDDWNLLRDKLEIDIIEKYACNAKYIIITIIVFCNFGILFLAIFQFRPLILDVILPLNASRPCQLIVITEYFVNKDKYLYIMLLHEFLTGYVGVTILCSISGAHLIYIIHACALFKIASYRIENAIEKSALEIPSPRKEYIFYRRIVRAVVIHQRAAKFIEIFTSNFMALYIILIMIGVSSLSLNLVQFLQVITLTDNIDEACIFAIMIFVHLNYMFVANYSGQKLTDHGIKVFEATYNGLWYAAPLHTQKLLLFIMQRAAINVVLKMSSIFGASLEGFASLTSAAISYFMVIYSTRQ